MSTFNAGQAKTPKSAVFFLVFVAALLLPVAGSGSDTRSANGQPWSIPLSAGGEIKMVWIGPGSFTMGSPESEPGHRPDETQFQVTLTHGYWMGATEITVAQWRDVMGTDLRGHLRDILRNDTLYNFGGRMLTIRDFMHMSADGDIGRYLANEQDNLPMYFTSWNDAMEFCAKLTQRERQLKRFTGRLQVYVA